MQHLLCAEEDGAELWSAAFTCLPKVASRDRLDAYGQLMELLRVAEVAARQNQDDRGCVALQSFLDRIPDKFFCVSAVYEENESWWRSQIEDNTAACPGTTWLLQKRLKNLRLG